MIQRKQTLWLLLAALSVLLIFYFPFGITAKTVVDSTSISEIPLSASESKPLGMLGILACILSIIIIFLFKNRPLQIKLIWATILETIGILVLQFYIANNSIEGNKLVVGILGANIYLGIFVPLITLFFLILAVMGIRQDEKLVRDTDRLR
jgi:hypothetical protein